MGTPRSHIERLIEMGLSRYGAGDLDGALLLWEEALAIDADNAQASSYVDYVRQNYDLLMSAEPVVEYSSEASFPIDEEPGYQIAAQPGEASVPATAASDLIDDGWEVEDAHAAEAHAAEAQDAEAQDAVTQDAEAQDAEADSGYTLELEAEYSAEGSEPPEQLELELEADEPPLNEVSFEEATREYQPGAHRTPESQAATDDAGAAEEPPAAEAARGDTEDAPAAPDELDAGTAGPTVGFFRGDDGTAGPTVGFFRGDDGTAGPTVGFFRGDDSTAGPTQGFFRGDEATIGITGDEGDAARADDSFAADEATSGFDPEGTPGLSNQATQIRKRDLGFVQAVAPATLPEPPTSSLAEGTATDADASDYEMTLEGAAYREVEPPVEDELDPLESLPTGVSTSASAAPELAMPGGTDAVLSNAPTRELAGSELRVPEPMLSAPTRELGLRPGRRPITNPIDEDAPTGQTDVRAIRIAAARNDGTAGRPVTESTATDVVLSFDPIVATSAQIFDEIEEDVPVTESTEDRTRRRISALLVKAAEWSEAGDLDRCAVAVDLALSEEPNSAVAQKLITRHRETIMTLLQSYLGDLDRTPQLSRPLQELNNAPIGPRAAFLLSRIDGMLTLDELLDVSGMPRLEALRHLCQLFLRGILR